MGLKCTNRQPCVRIHLFVCALQLGDDGVADYDTIIGMLPDVIADRGGKMFSKCRHVSKYKHSVCLV
jgi:hypothetical protein